MISQLPFEIWCMIFKKIENPFDLIKLCKVCKNWNYEIKKLLPFANWKVLCFERIRVFALPSIVFVQFPKLSIENYRSISNQDMWQRVYYQYKKWMQIKFSTARIFTTKNTILLSTNEYITCIDAWYNCIAYGTNCGIIYIIFNFDYLNPWRTVNHENTYVKEIRFWYNGNAELFLVSRTTKSMIKFWNVTHKGGTNDSSNYPAQQLCVGTAHNFYSVFTNALMKYIRAGTGNVIIDSYIRLSLSPGEKVIAISSQESNIFIVTKNKTVLKLFNVVDESIAKNGNTLRIESHWMIPPLFLLNFHIYITSNKTIFCNQGTLIGAYFPQINYWTTYNALKSFNSAVTALYMHGNYSIIGLLNGQVYMYYIEGISDLQNSDLFNKPPEKIFALDTTPIIAIKVTQILNESYIIATTKNNMYILRF